MNYIVKKLLKIIFTLFFIICLTFAFMKFIPGDPFSDEQALPPEIHKALRTHYGLEDVWYMQFARYLLALLHGDLGPSFVHSGQNVSQIILESFPVSAILGVEALLIAFSLGIVLGSISALKYNKWPDHFVTLTTIVGISLPSFILAGFLQYGFAIKLGWLPVARWGTWTQTILPALSLAAMPTAFIARQVRSNLISVLKQNYIRTAYSKGLTPGKIIVKHALRNALGPLFPYFGQLTANILIGSFVIEKIYGIPGLGQWFVTSVSSRDYTVIMGITIFYSVILLSLLFVADVIYALCDPRVKEITMQVTPS